MAIYVALYGYLYTSKQYSELLFKQLLAVIDSDVTPPTRLNNIRKKLEKRLQKTTDLPALFETCVDDLYSVGDPKVGDACANLGITEQQLRAGTPLSVDCTEVTNRVVLEIRKYWRQKHRQNECARLDAEKWIGTLLPDSPFRKMETGRCNH